MSPRLREKKFMQVNYPLGRPWGLGLIPVPVTRPIRHMRHRKMPPPAPRLLGPFAARNESGHAVNWPLCACRNNTLNTVQRIRVICVPAIAHGSQKTWPRPAGRFVLIIRPFHCFSSAEWKIKPRCAAGLPGVNQTQTQSSLFHIQPQRTEINHNTKGTLILVPQNRLCNSPVVVWNPRQKKEKIKLGQFQTKKRS